MSRSRDESERSKHCAARHNNALLLQQTRTKAAVRLIGFASLAAVIGLMPTQTVAFTCSDFQRPKNPIRIIVPTVSSGSSDFLARLIGTRLSDCWAQGVVVDNRAGANGVIALEILARAASDGQTMALLNVGGVITALVSGKYSFARGGDFAPIARLASSPLLFAMYAGVPAKSLKDLVELARAKPNYFSYATGGQGSIGHLGVALFASMAGIQLVQVPYRSSGAGFPDVIGGRVHLVQATPASLLPHVKTGRLTALAISGSKRTTVLPDAPTFAEAGYPAYDITYWFGMFGPATMPSPLLAQRNTEFNWVVQQSEITQKLSSTGMDSAGDLSAEQFADYIAAETAKWEGALKAAGMR